MYLQSKLEDYSEEINIAIVGCGKFITMFLAQYYKLKKINIRTIVDINIQGAKDNCKKAGLDKNTGAAPRT